jgi:hypothetical protein
MLRALRLSVNAQGGRFSSGVSRAQPTLGVRDRRYTERLNERRRTRRYAGTLVPIGNVRTTLPVAAKMALATAGAMGGTPGSPTPVGLSVDGAATRPTRGRRKRLRI